MFCSFSNISNQYLDKQVPANVKLSCQMLCTIISMCIYVKTDHNLPWQSVHKVKGKD